MRASSQVDHLVVAAQSLDQGVAWCLATFGIAPGPGGEHPFMGTHNRLLRIGSSEFPRAYLEIIAINPQAPAPRRKRWFDLDDTLLRSAIAQQPRLIHFVASCTPVAEGTRGLDMLGIDRGPLLAAQRETPAGLLNWRISVRDDGQRLFLGALPTLIEWGPTHPAASLPDSGLSLVSMMASHPRPDDLFSAYAAIGLSEVGVEAGPPNLTATLMTPVGEVRIESRGV